MKSKIVSAVILVLGLCLIYTPCIADLFLPQESVFDSLGTASEYYGDKISISSDESETDTKESGVTVITSMDKGEAEEDEEEISDNVDSTAVFAHLGTPIEQTDEIQVQSEHIQSGILAYENEAYVWVSKSGKKYHSSPDCSGMKSPGAITVDNAKEKGYEPCKKCFQST